MNIDKTRKVVSIVLMLLVIGTMVFNAFSLVGHCASDSSNSVTSFPLPVGFGWGNNFTPNDYNTIVTNISDLVLSQNDRDFPSVDTILLFDADANYYYFVIFSTTDFSVTIHGTSFDFLTDHFTLYSHVVGSNWGGQSTCRVSKSTLVADNWNYNTNSVAVPFSSFLTSSPAGGFVFPYGNFSYPSLFYSVNDLTYDGVTYFTSEPFSVSGGHSKGGDITQYTYDPTDTPEPADPSAVAGSGGWLSKILDSLNKIKNSIVYGFQNITDNLQSFFNQIYGGIEDQLNQIIDKLGGDVIDPSDTSLSDVFLSSFQSSKIYGVYSTYNQGRTIVQGLFNSVETPETLRFEFDLPTMNLSGHFQGGSSNPSYITKPYGSKLVMDFGWYEDVRSIVVPFIVAWLYVGMLIWIIRAIPGFISGSPSFNTRSVSDGSPIVNTHNEVSPNGFLVRKVGGK